MNADIRKLEEEYQTICIQQKVSESYRLQSNKTGSFHAKSSRLPIPLDFTEEITKKYCHFFMCSRNLNFMNVFQIGPRTFFVTCASHSVEFPGTRNFLIVDGCEHYNLAMIFSFRFLIITFTPYSKPRLSRTRLSRIFAQLGQNPENG